ncbi:MAG TPA: hypothetical protein PKM65_15755 [Spirochaetota bacterium]|nr:hypothetical protein [Spirochaetota bacterium]HNT11892.1 hypothetical protein [Spirochaetota bacterium]HNV47889.1 hypothetical protein [Spirochaetota bacterium]HOS38211.1 hypothetical protein [Spirochaetota bacterium]HPU89442.1 hypothetical protein [Spirochaetota bacterium]
MLYELKNIAQKETGVFRRWFEDNYFELIVWYYHDRSVKGFQLCYDRFRDEHAITWFDGKDVEHNRVDDERKQGSYAPTAILVADGVFPAAAVISRFREASAQIDPEIAGLVLRVLADHARGSRPKRRERAR